MNRYVPCDSEPGESVSSFKNKDFGAWDVKRF